MKNCISRVMGAAITAFVFAAAVTAQTGAISAAAGDKYLISAKAGGVNYVSGPVGVVRSVGKSGHLLKGDSLEIGDRVSTGADGKVEVLLNPGSYLRMGGSSAFEFKSTSLDDLSIRLDSGSAIFEVFATEDFVVTVNTPKTKFSLVDSGVYRIDVESAGTGKLEVWKGKALVNDSAEFVKAGREAALKGNSVAIAKFDRDEKDVLDLWSKERAKELANITGQLARNTMRTALMRSYLGRQWDMFSSFGLWVYDPWRRSHCFLPFGLGWGSPYGYGFGNSIWYYNLPGVIFTPPAGGGPVRNISTVKPGRVIDNTPVRPPFAQVQGSSSATGRDVSSVKPGRASSIAGPSFDPDPIRSSAPSSFPSIPASAPVRSVSDTKGRP